MSDGLFVDTSELDAWAAKLNGGGAVVLEETGVAMQRAVLGVQYGAQTAAPVWTGNLRRSILGRVVSPTLGTVGTNVPYARPVNFGRRAGAAMPPVAAITPWVTSHGMPAEAAFPVARAIGRRGIPAKPFLTGTFERMKGQIVAEFRAVLPRVVARLRP